MNTITLLFGIIYGLVVVNGAFTPILTYPYVPTTTFLRTPQHDSAIVTSEQQGGNFIYSVSEGHAYETVQPYIQTLAQPVGYSYQWHSIPIASSIQNLPIYAPQPFIETIPAEDVPASIAPPSIVESTQSTDDKTIEESSLKSDDVADDTVSIESA